MAGIIDKEGIARLGGVEEAGEVGGEDLSGVGYVLQGIGFELASERVSIVEARLNQFEDFRYLVEKDIHDWQIMNSGSVHRQTDVMSLDLDAQKS